MAPEHEAVVAMKAGPVPSRKRCHHDGGANGPRTEQQEHHGLCSQNGGERKSDKRGGVAPHRKGPERDPTHCKSLVAQTGVHCLVFLHAR
jgi:hypothetical protein